MKYRDIAVEFYLSGSILDETVLKESVYRKVFSNWATKINWLKNNWTDITLFREDIFVFI